MAGVPVVAEIPLADEEAFSDAHPHVRSRVYELLSANGTRAIVSGRGWPRPMFGERSRGCFRRAIAVICLTLGTLILSLDSFRSLQVGRRALCRGGARVFYREGRGSGWHSPRWLFWLVATSMRRPSTSPRTEREGKRFLLAANRWRGMMEVMRSTSICPEAGTGKPGLHVPGCRLWTTDGSFR